MAILIVDDESGIRSSLRDILEHEEYTIYEASNGLDALGKLSELSGQIEVILVDIRMPKMNGLALIEHLTLYYPYVVGIIILTAYGNVSNKEFFYEDQSSPYIIKQDFITKPPHLSELLETVKRAVNAVQLRKKRLETDFQKLVLSRLDESNQLNTLLNNTVGENNKFNNFWRQYLDSEIDSLKSDMKDFSRKLDNISDCVTVIENDLSIDKGYKGLMKKIGNDLISVLIIGLSILALFYLGIDDFIKKILGL